MTDNDSNDKQVQITQSLYTNKYVSNFSLELCNEECVLHEPDLEYFPLLKSLFITYKYSQVNLYSLIKCYTRDCSPYFDYTTITEEDVTETFLVILGYLYNVSFKVDFFKFNKDDNKPKHDILFFIMDVLCIPITHIPSVFLKKDIFDKENYFDEQTVIEEQNVDDKQHLVDEQQFVETQTQVFNIINEVNVSNEKENIDHNDNLLHKIDEVGDVVNTLPNITIDVNMPHQFYKMDELKKAVLNDSSPTYEDITNFKESGRYAMSGVLEYKELFKLLLDTDNYDIPKFCIGVNTMLGSSVINCAIVCDNDENKGSTVIIHDALLGCTELVDMIFVPNDKSLYDDRIIKYYKAPTHITLETLFDVVNILNGCLEYDAELVGRVYWALVDLNFGMFFVVNNIMLIFFRLSFSMGNSDIMNNKDKMSKIMRSMVRSTCRALRSGLVVVDAKIVDFMFTAFLNVVHNKHTLVTTNNSLLEPEPCSYSGESNLLEVAINCIPQLIIHLKLSGYLFYAAMLDVAMRYTD